MYGADSFRNIDNFINPDQMLRGLLSTSVGDCHCNEPE